MECFPRKHLVRKDNKQKPGFNRRLSTRVGSKRQLVSSLSWPAGELPMRSPEDRRRNLLTPDLLRAKSKVVPRSRSEMSAKERSALKAERLKRGRHRGLIYESAHVKATKKTNLAHLMKLPAQ